MVLVVQTRTFQVSLGVGGSYLNSLVVIAVRLVNPLFDKPVMFETSGMLLAFVTLGKAFH